MIFIINNNSYMNQEKPLNNLQLERPISRRSRKDEEGRDFQCGCGKRYLSYPALYTHIKTKHDGRQPEGTQKTATALIAKKIKSKTQDQNLKGLTSYLDKDDLKLLAELDQNNLGSVSLALRFKKEMAPKEIYQSYQNLIKHPEMVLSKNSNIDLLLAVYLFNLGQYVNEKLYDHYLLFAKLLRNCYFEHGEDVFRNCFSNRQSQTFIETFTPGEVQYVPIICDCLLRYYIPSAKEYKDINLSLMQLMLSDFCCWLFKKKYTNIKVTLKKEYRLETKPTPLHKQRYSNGNNSSKDKQESCSEQNKGQKEDSDHQNSEDLSQDQIIEERNVSESPDIAQTDKMQQQLREELINSQKDVKQSKNQIIMRSQQMPITQSIKDRVQTDRVPQQSIQNHQNCINASMDPQRAPEAQLNASTIAKPQQSKE